MRLGFFLPGDVIDYQLAVEPLPAGAYRATLRLDYAGQTVQATETVDLPGVGEVIETTGNHVPAGGESKSADLRENGGLDEPAAQPTSSPSPTLPLWLAGAAGGIITLLLGVVVWQALRLRRPHA